MTPIDAQGDALALDELRPIPFGEINVSSVGKVEEFIPSGIAKFFEDQNASVASQRDFRTVIFPRLLSGRPAYCSSLMGSLVVSDSVDVVSTEYLANKW